MTNYLESIISGKQKDSGELRSGWLKLGVLAAASALAGGLAAAWWYRKTLTKLHQVEENVQNPHFGIPGDDQPDRT